MKVDLRAYHKFLTSDEGGAWTRDEIVVLQDPTWELAHLHLLEGSTYEFTLVVFAGHGCHDPWREVTQVAFAHGERVDLVSLRTGSPRQVIIADSCRTIPVELMERGDIIIGSDFGYEPNAQRRRSCRALYDRAILEAEVGTTFVLACDIGEGADETPDGGGEFTRYLIGTGIRWAQVARSGPLASRILSVRDGFRHARELMQRNGIAQKPQITTGRRHRHFPLAVT